MPRAPNRTDSPFPLFQRDPFLVQLLSVHDLTTLCRVSLVPEGGTSSFIPDRDRVSGRF